MYLYIVVLQLFQLMKVLHLVHINNNKTGRTHKKTLGHSGNIFIQRLTPFAFLGNLVNFPAAILLHEDERAVNLIAYEES